MIDALTFRDEPWMASANCRGADPELFFPNMGDSGTRAKVICAGCIVRTQCLEYAFRIGGAPKSTDWGIYGGTDPFERHRMRKGKAS